MDVESLKPDADLWGTEKDSGETVVIPVYLQKPKHRDYAERWLTFWQDDAEGTGVSLIEMAADKRLTATDFRVRDYLFCKVGFANAVHFSQSEAAKYLGIAQPNISASIKKLIALGIIIEGPKKGLFRSYVINPATVYMGKHEVGITKRRKAIKDHKAKVIPFPVQEQHSLS
jgi:DNA-binding MarR family transcriptional regulator